MIVKITPQEELIAGSTPRSAENWHAVSGVESNDEIKQINIQRQEKGFIFNALMARIFGVEKIGIKLAEINSKTGETEEDPRVFTWDEENNQPGREITKEFYDLLKKDGIDLHLRSDIQINKEGAFPKIEG